MVIELVVLGVFVSLLVTKIIVDCKNFQILEDYD